LDALQFKIDPTQLNSMPHGMKNEKNEMKQNKTMKVKKMK
jgi:hypothetical protein